MKLRLLVALLAVSQCSLVAAAQPATAVQLRVGASRVDYTPAAPLPRGFLGVLDPIYVRSIVVDNGRTRAALVAVDAGAIPTDLFNKISARATRDLAIPVTQLLLSATHTHSVPFQLGGAVEEKIMQSLREAVDAAAAGAACLGHGGVIHKRQSRPRGYIHRKVPQIGNVIIRDDVEMGPTSLSIAEHWARRSSARELRSITWSRSPTTWCWETIA